jgi:hypothetical protein
VRTETLDKAIEALSRHERTARRRTTAFTLIPLLLGAIWLVYSLWVVRENLARAEDARQRARSAEASRARSVAAQREAELQLQSIRRQIEALQPQLAALQTRANTQTEARAVDSVVAQTQRIRTATVAAESDLRATRLMQRVEALFGRSSGERQKAYSDIGREFRNDPQAVDSLLNYAARHRGNPNGIYNTVVTLKLLSREVTRPRRDHIASFCQEASAGPNVQRTADRCAELLAWIDSPRSTPPRE